MELNKKAFSDSQGAVPDGETAEELPFDPIAMTSDRIKVNWAANLVLKVDDPEALVQIATMAPLDKVRLFATRKLTDQRVLFDIAQNDPEPFVCEAAAKRLTEPALVKRLAIETREFKVGSHALAVLTSQDDLVDVAVCARSRKVRERAAEHVTDQATLADIALADSDEPPAALHCIIDQEQLRRVYEGAPGARTRAMALAQAGGRLCEGCSAPIWPEGGNPVPDICPICGFGK